MPDDATFDVVVVGAGMGGLAAAVAAAEDGARVLLAEKAAEPGGSFALSGGYIWTVPSLGVYQEVVPEGDPALGRLIVEHFEDAIDWLREHGGRVGPRVEGAFAFAQGRGYGYPLKPDTITAGIKPLLQALERAGGALWCSAPVRALVQDDQGRIRGVRIGRAGNVRTVQCQAVVLATGGFQGDAELRARYLGPWADRCVIRACPTSTGDGLRLAMAAGAALTGALHAFYGHLLPAKPARIEPGAFRSLSQYYSTETVLLNLRGERFVDESLGDEFATQALAREPNALGFLVFDQICYRERISARPRVPGEPVADPFKTVPSAGGVIVRADTVDELVHALAEWGVPPEQARQTLITYDAAMAAGNPASLPVPRRRWHHRILAEPPFYAVPVRPGITFTHGGIRVNPHLQALDRDGRPIPGLYVAGVDVGGIFYEGYVGGLSASLVTGLNAGLNAARSAGDAKCTW